MDIILAFLAAVVGIIVGGLVNVLADDLPERDRLHWPHYADGEKRSTLAALGILAFVTGQRASSQGAKLSWRHPVVEVLMGGIFVLLALGGFAPLQLAFYLVFLAVLVLVTVIDVEHRLILTVVIVPACLFAIIESVLAPVPPPDLRDALLGGLLGFGIFLLMFLGGIAFSALMAALRGEELAEVAFGFGDVMLATLSGLMLGWQAFIFALMITVFLGAAGAVIYLGSRLVLRGRYVLFTALPYGPYIVLGTVIMLFWRDEVRALLLR